MNGFSPATLSLLKQNVCGLADHLRSGVREQSARGGIGKGNAAQRVDAKDAFGRRLKGEASQLIGPTNCVVDGRVHDGFPNSWVSPSGATSRWQVVCFASDGRGAVRIATRQTATRSMPSDALLIKSRAELNVSFP